MATIKDVSELAGVSMATVSRVINGSEYVKEQTRRSVQAAMDSLGYKPNALAQALATSSYNTYGLVLPHFTSHYYSSMLSEAAQGMQKAGKKLLVINSSDNEEGEIEGVRSLNSHHCDAIFIYSRHLSEQQLLQLQKEANTQLIVLNRAFKDNKLLSFGFDQYQLGQVATNHLIELGHRRIACITTPLSSSTGQQRLLGYKDSLQVHDIQVDDALIYQGESTPESGYQATIALIESGADFSAIFSCTDWMAFGVIRALHDKGISVPDEVSVIGIDGDPAGLYMIPRLSTVELPIVELMRNAVATALMLNKGLSESQQNFPQYRGVLKVNDSTQRRI